jgi:hypothetical protein
MIWDNFTFIYPFAFLIVLFYLLCRKFCKVKQQTIPFSNLVLLKAITSKENKIKEFLELLFIVCISFAIANPVIEQTSQKIDKNGYEIAISLDASMSMIGVPLSQQLKILSQVKNEGFDPKIIDMKLVKMGYQPIFTDCYED